MWGFVSLGSTHCDRVFLFFRGSLVTRWEAPGGFWASCILWLANFSVGTLMLLVGLLTCKTVSRITYTVLVETLNRAQSNPILTVTGFLVLCTDVQGCCCDCLWTSTTSRWLMKMRSCSGRKNWMTSILAKDKLFSRSGDRLYTSWPMNRHS